MSEWTHSQCDACWFAANPDREPYRLMIGGTERCCTCGRLHDSRIWVRADPADLAYCPGQHD